MPLSMTGVNETLRRVRDAARPWLRWWRGELQLAWNDSLDRLLPALRTFTELQPVEGGFDIVQRRGREVIATHRIAQADALPEGVAGSRAVLLLPGQEVLVRRLRLPAAIESRLRESLALRIDRDMPLRPDLVCFDFAVVARDAQAGMLDVDLAIARRARIEEWEQRLRAMGVRPAAIGTRFGANGASQVNFLHRRADSPDVGRGRSRFDRPLVAAAALMAVAAVALIGWQFRAERRAMDEAIAAVRAAAESAQADRQKLLEYVETARELRANLERAPVSATLADLSGRIAPHSWIQMFQLRGDEVRLSGIGPNAPALVAELQQSPLFGQVTLTSSASAGIGTGEDNFEVTIRMREAAP